MSLYASLNVARIFHYTKLNNLYICFGSTCIQWFKARKRSHSYTETAQLTPLFNRLVVRGRRIHSSVPVVVLRIKYSGGEYAYPRGELAVRAAQEIGNIQVLI